MRTFITGLACVSALLILSGLTGAVLLGMGAVVNPPSPSWFGVVATGGFIWASIFVLGGVIYFVGVLAEIAAGEFRR